MTTETPQFETIEELQAFHDERFIRLAYQTILGREVDEGALINLLAHIRVDKTAEDILEILCTSEECKRRYALDGMEELQIDVESVSNAEISESDVI
jgi:hypothetical protein